MVVQEETIGYGGAVVLYQAPDGSVSLDVRLEKETIWLTQKQMASIFATERSVITKHIRNIFNSAELNEKSNVQKMHVPGSDKPVAFYNLDVAISVGYRVNSKRGTQFRIWATQVLRDHIIKGYSVNKRRLKQLRQSIKLIGQVLERHELTSDETAALLRVVSDYERALDLIDDYDHGRIKPFKSRTAAAACIAYDEAKNLIDTLRVRFKVSNLFGREKDNSLHSSLNAVFQTYRGKDLYPGIESKASHLLYFLVKNHSFVDGNKRIAAALFLRFLDKNRLLYRPDGSRLLSDTTLVALTLMIAESRPEQKDILTTIVSNLIFSGEET